MKRALTGGSYRGPPGLRRQRRTIRFVQLLLLAIGFGLAAFALASTFDVGQRPPPRTLARQGSLAQPIVLGLLAFGAWGASWLLADGREVRIPTPARLDELAGRAEQAALARASASATEED